MKNESVLPFARLPREVENLETDRKKAYCGYLSKGSARVIEKRLQCWFNCMFINNRENLSQGQVRPYMPVMITVTLSDTQKHDDQYIKRHMLQEFLKALSRKKDIKYSFWKAEAQKNGNVHFHIIIDRYVNKYFIQGLWNHYQQVNGYLDNYKEKFGSYNAPSTKITGMKAEKSPISYVLKYVQKGAIRPQRCMQTETGCLRVCKALEAIRRPIDGAVFRFSSALVIITPKPLWMSATLNDHLNDEIDRGLIRVAVCDHCTILYSKGCKAYNLLTDWFKKELDQQYRDIFEYLYIKNGVLEKVLNPVNIEIKKQLIIQTKLDFMLN